MNVEAILQESTIYRRWERLGRITDGLGLRDAYGATIEGIKARGEYTSVLGMGALMWISHAERSLRADELCHALAVELGSTNFNADNVPSISTLVGCCQGLIAVDKEGSTVRLIHFTLKEYLSSRPDIFSRPDSAMAEVCLTYLNSEQVKAISTDLSPNMLDSPFLEYCSLYWGVHAKENSRIAECHSRYSYYRDTIATYPPGCFWSEQVIYIATIPVPVSNSVGYTAHRSLELLTSLLL